MNTNVVVVFVESFLLFCGAAITYCHYGFDDVEACSLDLTPPKVGPVLSSHQTYRRN